MSEIIKPDLILPMKRCWFVSVWKGEKTVEYREVKPYWTKRIGNWVDEYCFKFVEMRLGYKRDTLAMMLHVYRADIGKCPYEGWDGDYYRLHFRVAGYYMRQGGEYCPRIPEHKIKELANECNRRAL